MVYNFHHFVWCQSPSNKKMNCQWQYYFWSHLHPIMFITNRGLFYFRYWGIYTFLGAISYNFCIFKGHSFNLYLFRHYLFKLYLFKDYLFNMCFYVIYFSCAFLRVISSLILDWSVICVASSRVSSFSYVFPYIFLFQWITSFEPISLLCFKCTLDSFVIIIVNCPTNFFLLRLFYHASSIYLE